MSPPGMTPASGRADYSRNTLTYSDPTGEKAIRTLLDGGGPFQITAENGFRLFTNRESLEYMLLGMESRPSRTGKTWIYPIESAEKTTPAASDANQTRCEGSTRNPNQ